ncbi:MAG: hypothetical protein LUH55_10200 [Bacteroides thetaiotaomicron]|nr:hypothetical protein [Bacteroides thetaiotaomicron]
MNNRMNAVDRALCRLFRQEIPIRSRSFMSRLPKTETTQEMMKAYITSDTPFLLLRFGLYEYQLCYQYLEKKNGLRKEYSDFIQRHIRMDAGILAKGDVSLDKYAQFIVENLYEADIMGYWRNYPEKLVFSSYYSSGCNHVDIIDLYPYLYWHKNKLPDWQMNLSGRKVLVVTSFARTIEKQYSRRKSIWKDADRILPEFELIVYQAVQTSGGSMDERFASWEEAVEHMEKEVLQIDFDIALVSCGGYGLPLAIRLKKTRKESDPVGRLLSIMVWNTGRSMEECPGNTKICE